MILKIGPCVISLKMLVYLLVYSYSPMGFVSTGSQSSYSGGQLSSGYSGGYSSQGNMGGYSDYSECQLCYIS